MSQYKILKLPQFFHITELANTLQLSDEPVRSKDQIQERIRRTLKGLLGLEQTKPVFNRDGWYYDRKTNNCWAEWNGTAWKMDKQQFLYELQQLNTPTLHPDEVKAIQTLILFGNCPKSLRQLLKQHQENESINQSIKRQTIIVNRVKRELGLL